MHLFSTHLPSLGMSGGVRRGPTWDRRDHPVTGGGLLIGGKTIEELTLGENTAAAQATPAAAGPPRP